MAKPTFKLTATPNRKGRQCDIDIDKLVIPSLDEKDCPAPIAKLFQRPLTGSARIKWMARNWFWSLAQPTTVGEINGVYYVIDGGHRLRAARLNGKIKKLQCVLFTEFNWADAARVFIELQKSRKNINSVQTHFSSLIAEDQTAKDVDSIVKNAGYEIGAAGDYKFSAVNALYRLYALDELLATKAMRICANICDGERIFKELLFGVYELEKECLLQNGRTAFNDGNMDKLIKAGTVRIMSAINNKRANCGKSGGSQSRVIPAIAIRDLINKGKSKGKLRVKFPIDLI